MMLAEYLPIAVLATKFALGCFGMLSLFLALKATGHEKTQTLLYAYGSLLMAVAL